jgi:hypothetical protein
VPFPKPIAYGLFALLLGVVTMAATLHSVDWSLTALPRVDSTTGMGAAARSIDPSFHTVHPGAYDGQFYWGIAIDPIGTGTLHTSFDNAAYRYGHPLLGWLGWLLSAGQAGAVPAALAALGLAALFAAGTLAAALGAGWEALFVALNPGLLFASNNVLAEPLAAALMLGAFLAYRGGRRPPLIACLVLLPLAKEPLILVAAALALWELHRGRARYAVALAATAVPAALWWIYARAHFGAWFTSGDSALGAPFAGWRRALLDAGVFGSNAGQGNAGALVLPIFVALLGLLAFAALRALRLRDPKQLAYLLLAALAACLAANATVSVSDAVRNTAVLLVLVPFAITGSPTAQPLRRASGRR